MEADDGELVRRCLAGDQSACADLVSGCARMVGTVIWRATGDGEVVEDLTQETLLRAFKALPYFAARAKLSTWICTIAHRVAIDHLRKTGRWKERTLEATNEDDGDAAIDRQPSRELDPEAAAIRTELDRLIRDRLAQLPERYRLPLVYAAIEGLDYATIAAMLGMPVGTVKTLVFRAKLMLRKQIVAALEAPVSRREASDAL